MSVRYSQYHIDRRTAVRYHPSAGIHIRDGLPCDDIDTQNSCTARKKSWTSPPLFVVIIYNVPDSRNGTIIFQKIKNFLDYFRRGKTGHGDFSVVR